MKAILSVLGMLVLCFVSGFQLGWKTSPGPKDEVVQETAETVYEEPKETVSLQDKIAEHDRRLDLQVKFNSTTLANNSTNAKSFNDIRERLKKLEEVVAEPVIDASLEERIKKLEESQVTKADLDAIRWEIDDLKLRNRSPEELEDALKGSKDHPESVVEVSKDYPKWRLPYGVKLNDKRPPEVVAEAIERTKAGKGIVYMWLSFPRENDRELRVYMTEIGWKEPAPPAGPAEATEEPTCP